MLYVINSFMINAIHTCNFRYNIRKTVYLLQEVPCLWFSYSFTPLVQLHQGLQKKAKHLRHMSSLLLLHSPSGQAIADGNIVNAAVVTKHVLTSP